MGRVTPYETSGGRRYRVPYRKPDHKQTDKPGFRTKRDATCASLAVSAGANVKALQRMLGHSSA